MSSPTLIDDSNTAVQYSHNWTWVPNLVPEVDHTRHGVSEAGQTASLAFTGTGIQVFGTLQPSDVAGQPTTQYAIDGTVVATYTAPFTPSGPSVLNVTFFSKLDLSAEGDHEIVITNVNGTSPNIFWLDFFLVYTSTSQNPPTGSSSSGVVAVTATSTSGSGSKTISVKTAGAIAGGVAGGLAIVIILLVTYIVRLKRRHKHSERLVQPYVPPSSDGTVVAVSPRRKAGSPPILPSPTASESAGPSSAAAMSAIGPVVPLSASRVNVASSTGALSENGTSASGGDSASMTESGAGLLVRQPHHDRDRDREPGPTRSPEEVLSLAQSLLHAVAQGQGARRQGEGQREDPRPGGAVAMDSGLRLYNEAMLPPSYSSS